MIFTGSRYVQTAAFVKSGDVAVLAIRERNNFNLDKSTHYTVIQGDSIDCIAYKLYGNAQLWWAIMDSNPKYQSELEIRPGDVLVIPPYEDVVKVCE